MRDRETERERQGGYYLDHVMLRNTLGNTNYQADISASSLDDGSSSAGWRNIDDRSISASGGNGLLRYHQMHTDTVVNISSSKKHSLPLDTANTTIAAKYTTDTTQYYYFYRRHLHLHLHLHLQYAPFYLRRLQRRINARTCVDVPKTYLLNSVEDRQFEVSLTTLSR
jgi:hypothetical protein